MKPYLLRFHRWLTLFFSIPWLIILVTGLIVSFEPMMMDRVFTGRTVSLASVEAAIAKHDPAGKANTLNIRAYDNFISLAEGRGAVPTRIDLLTGEKVAAGSSLRSDLFSVSRNLHQSLLLDLKWLVDASTIAMLLSMMMGVLMGLPRLNTSLGGWHKMTAWATLPLLVLSPLTGLAIAYSITFTSPPPKPEGAPVKLAEAIKLVAAKHDLASVYWIRPMGGAMRARIYDGREAKTFVVAKDGLVAGQQAWPRAIHEGVWAGVWSALINVLTSIALIGLFVTGLWIWARRKLRFRANRRARLNAAR